MDGRTPAIVLKWLELRDKKLKLESELDSIKEEMEKLKAQIASEVFHNKPGEYKIVDFSIPGICPVLKYQIVSSTRIDTKALKQQYPKLYEALLIRYEYDRLTVEFGHSEKGTVKEE